MDFNIENFVIWPQLAMQFELSEFLSTEVDELWIVKYKLKKKNCVVSNTDLKRDIFL